MKSVYGLIGESLKHSFSKEFFTSKFQELQLHDHSYELFELPLVTELPLLVEKQPNLRGLNVTIPYKQAVLPFLHDVDEKAASIGAVNVIKIVEGKLFGYNSDYSGFKNSLVNFLGSNVVDSALILGSGGAAKAVAMVLRDLSIAVATVSRSGQATHIYDDLHQPNFLNRYQLIVNTTPLGMYPETDRAPNLDYSQVAPNHYLFDLIYNPEKTKFLQLGEQNGARIMGGMEMLKLQAEKSWEIWNR